MNMYTLLGSIALVSSILLYLLFRWWATGREDEGVYPKEMTRLGRVRAYMYIIILLVISVVFFIKAIN